MKTKLLVAKGIRVSVSVIAFTAMVYSSDAWAQGTVESCDGGKNWSPSCGGGTSSGGGSGGGPSFQNLFNNLGRLFGSRPPSTTTRAPDPADIAFDQGKAAAKAGRWEEAEKAFRRALALEKRQTGLVGIHAHLSLVYWQLGRLEDSISAAREGLRIDPNNDWCKGQLVALLTARLAAKEKAGITEGAEEDYREALALAPDNPNVQSWKSWIEEIREAHQAKQMRERLFESLSSKANTGTGLTVMDLSSASNSKAQAASSGGLQPLGLDAFKPGNPPPAEVKSYIEPRQAESESGKRSVSTKAGDQLKSAATLRPEEGSEKVASEAARLTFDTAGKDAGSLPPVSSNLGKTRYEVPTKYADKPDIVQMEQKRRRLEARVVEIENERADVERQRNAETNPEKRGKLEVKLTNLDLEKANIPSQLQVLVINQQEAVERYENYAVSLGQSGSATPTGNAPSAAEERRQ